MNNYQERALNFCTYIRSLYSDERKKIDFIISQTYIKMFFYFKYEGAIDTVCIVDELNCALKVFKLNQMSEFYMKVNNAEGENFYMCWSFFSYNNLGDYYR